MVLTSLPAPFSDREWLFEVKFDGFRSLCYLDQEDVRLVSRRGHTYKSFRNLCDCIASDVRAEDAILDGEIVCLDEADQCAQNQFSERGFYDSEFKAGDVKR
jgi:bifunctional non-homologous end joining protein LigD